MEIRRICANSVRLSALLFLLLLFLPSSGFSNTAAETITLQPEAAQEAAGKDMEIVTDGETVVVASETPVRKAFLYKWLHMLDKSDESDSGNSSVMVFVTKVPGDLARVLKPVGGDKGFTGVLGALFISLLSILLGWLVSRAAKRLTRNVSARFEQITPPEDTRVNRLWCGFLNHLPALTLLILFAIVTTLIFLLIGNSVSVKGRMLFQFLLGTLLITRFLSLIGQVIFAPKNATVRIFDLSDSLSTVAHRAFTIATTTVFSGTLFLHFIRELGARSQTSAWMETLIGSIVIGVFAYLVVDLREPIAAILKKDDTLEGKGWLKDQLVTHWHVPALLYLFVIWFIFVGQEMTGTLQRNGSFIISLIIIPIYLVLSQVGYLIIRAVIESLGIVREPEADMITGEVEEFDEQELKQRFESIVSRCHFIYKILLFVSLATWLLSLWGYNIPFAQNAVRAIFESLVILSLALAFWRFSSRYLEKKIEDATPEVVESDDDDNEFGGAAPRGRISTLLPMLRKVIGTILVVMVALIVLSSLGVNIGPLLAGAGVIGLAVGFGAQKLVSDILSGFFFLLDDAFRVGEYIQAGSIRGTVETITLRNVMLRHHLGMLQVVPHSDLGAITNYMRGGIIIKFPLEFPYDVDINKVRKIIKKVGQEMLEDEELGDDFLQPVKSQGVYQITNSVMVIRVKFTAKPGKQFVIKREAFRRLTEAFNAKGIYYAHRKVIVDIAGDNVENLKSADQTKVMEAGAAAALLQMQEEEALKAKEEEDKKS